MTILIGLVPGRRDEGAVHLGARLARSSGESLVAVVVTPEPWPPDPQQRDKEYRDYQDAVADQALARARLQLGTRHATGGATAEFLRRRAESVAAGLLEVIAERRVDSVVLGSSSTGLLGRVMLGDVAERILHGAELPVAVAPRSFHDDGTRRISQVSVAFGRADHDSGLLRRSVLTARAFGASLRVVCFAVRPMAGYVGGVEPSTEDLVVGEWMKRLHHDFTTILGMTTRGAATGSDRASNATSLAIDLGQGSTWAQAMSNIDWSDGDLLVVGTSSGPLSRFYLGSHAVKIIRNSPVPVLLLPRD